MNLQHTCPVCDTLFTHWKDYHNHLAYTHGVVHPSKLIRPINLSGRSKAEIVANAENTWLRPALVLDECREGCMCRHCFQKALDGLVDKTEREMNECSIH